MSLDLGQPTGRQLRVQDWWAGQVPQRVLTALDNRAWFVGGAVRDSILLRPVEDIDLATLWATKQMQRRLKDRGFWNYVTGKRLGTITVERGGWTAQITPVQAEPGEPRDALGDAFRRDFTMNTLTADHEGWIYDPVGEGLSDLLAGRVRFVTPPAFSLEEDPVRLVRWLRFQAIYGREAPDGETMAACSMASRELLPGAEAFRVGLMLQKLLACKAVLKGLDLAERVGALRVMLPRLNMLALRDLLADGLKPDWRQRLAVLLPPSEVKRVFLRYAWPRDDRDHVEQLQDLAYGRPVAVAVLARRYPAEVLREALAVATALGRDEVCQVLGGVLKPGGEEGGHRRFPLKRRHITALGWEGEDADMVRSALKSEWVASGRTMDRAALLDLAERWREMGPEPGVETEAGA